MNNNNNNKQPLDLTDSLLDRAKRGENHENKRPPSICKVSRILRELNERSFNPQLVSIGPIHSEDPKLQEFEKQKERYLNDLLSRCNSMPKETVLEECRLKVNNLIRQIEECYAGVRKNYSDDKLVTMMVMDGCFILEFCFKHKKANLDLPNKMQNSRIAMDLMLLENQVPFFVLQALFHCLAPYIGPVTLSKVLDTYLAPYIKLFREKNSTTDVESDSEVGQHSAQRPNTPGQVHSDSTPADHVLGYMHKLYHLEAAKSSEPKPAEASKPLDEEQAAKSSEPKDAEASKPVDEEQTAKSWNRIMDAAFHSIVELDRSGMNFKRHQEDEWSMTIKFEQSYFWSKPSLLMPTLVIDDDTELILRNFIAYEQSFPQDHRYYFTSYAHAMDKLIDSKEDIAKLVESNVFVNNLGSNEEAADMINKICKNIFFTEFYYTDVFKQMDTYYSGYWPNTIAWLRRVYFSSPWSVIALLAGSIVFLATVVSGIFAVLQYFAGGSNQ